MTSNAERQRRYRERQKAGQDAVRSFLNGVIADTKRSVADADVKTPAWHLTRADTAVGLLALLDERPARDASMLPFILRTLPDVTEEAIEREFIAWLKAGNGSEKARRLTSPVTEQAELSLSWADSERIAGRGTSPVLAEGLRACTKLIKARNGQAVGEAYAVFLTTYTVRAITHLLHGEPS